MVTDRERKQWVDALKYFAMFFIYLTHFIASYYSHLFSYWNRIPFSIVLYGLSGKLCVSFLGICLGYFAFNNHENHVTKYILRRYVYFFICGLFINTIRAALYAIGVMKLPFDVSNPWHVIRTVIVESITIGDGIYPTFWCVFPFFVSSVFAYINGRLGVGPIGIIIQIICFWEMKQTWVAICLIGALVAVFEQKKLLREAMKKYWIKILIAAGIFILIKRKESNITYLIDGICSGAFLLLIEFSPRIQAVICRHHFIVYGKNIMAIFLIHVVIYATVGKWMFALLTGFPYIISFVLTVVSCWIIILLVSIPVTRLLNCSLKRISFLLDKYIRE